MALMDLLPQVDPELAYRLATQPAYPGWGFMVANGANTMWETWDGSASRNHPPFCLISGYFYKYLAGIRCVSEYPGFKRFVIDPSVVGDLTFVEAWHDSMYGRIESGWKRDGERLTLDVTVPVNTSAVVHVPAASAEGDHRIGPSGGGGPGRSVLADGERQGVVRSGFGHLSFSKFYLNKKCVGSCVFAGSTHFFVK